MTRKTTPEKPPTNSMARTAAKAMAKGKATPSEIRSMGARIESERAAAKKRTTKS